MKPTKEPKIETRETYYFNGESDIQVFNDSGDNISHNPPVVKFITEYKERVKDFGKNIVWWDSLKSNKE